MKTSGMVQHVHTIFGVLGLSFSRLHAGLSRFRRRRRRARRRRGRCPVPVPDSQQGDDRPVRARRRCASCPMRGRLDTLMKAVSYYRPIVMRKGAFRGLDADVPQVAVVNVLATPCARARRHRVTPRSRRSWPEPRNWADSIRCFGAQRTCSRRCARKACGAEFGGVKLHPGRDRAYARRDCSRYGRIRTRDCGRSVPTAA